jgi:hypothetical protein
MRFKLVCRDLDLIVKCFYPVDSLEQLSDINQTFLNVRCLLSTQFQNSLAILPNAELRFLHDCGIVAAVAVLFPVHPRTAIGVYRCRVRIGRREDPKPLTLISLEKALIPFAISPLVDTETRHFAVDPFTSELLFVDPLITSEACNLAVFPAALVGCAISPHVDAEPVLLAIAVIAREPRAIFPLFDTNTMCLTIFPHALIGAAILMDGKTKSMLKVVMPLAFVNFALFCNEFPLAVGSAKIPLSLILCAVSKHNFAFTVPETSKPLALVDVATFLVLISLQHEA